MAKENNDPKREVYTNGDLSIHEASLGTIYEIGSWNSYLDGDEDITYIRDEDESYSYSDDYVIVCCQHEIIGYSIGYAKNIIEENDDALPYFKQYEIADLSVSCGEADEDVTKELFDYLLRRAAANGCDIISIRKNYPEFTRFYSFIENAFGMKEEDGIYTLAVPNTDKSPYKNALSHIDKGLTKSELYYLTVGKYTFEGDFAFTPYLEGKITVDLKDGSVTLPKEYFPDAPRLNIKKEKDRTLIKYLSETSYYDDTPKVHPKAALHGKEYVMADALSGKAAVICVETSLIKKSRFARDQLLSTYSPGLHALYKYDSSIGVCVFSSEFDPELETIDAASTMYGIGGIIREISKSLMGIKGGIREMLTPAEKAFADTPERLVFSFDNHEICFSFAGDDYYVKIDDKIKKLKDGAKEKLTETLRLLHLSSWKKEYVGDGDEEWMLRILAKDKTVFRSEGRGAYPPVWQFALDIYYDFANIT